MRIDRGEMAGQSSGDRPGRALVEFCLLCEEDQELWKLVTPRWDMMSFTL